LQRSLHEFSAHFNRFGRFSLFLIGQNRSIGGIFLFEDC
jgi:hypothetical protein